MSTTPTVVPPGADAGRRAPASRPGGDRRALRVLLVGLVLAALVAGLGVWWTQHRLVAQIDRVDVFGDSWTRPDRPTGAAAGAVNVLLLGTDARTREATTGTDATAGWEPGAQRSDLMMLVHVDADRDGASVVSIPRDTWTDVPGRGAAKINAAFSYGGPSLAVRTVEEMTGVRVDHLAWIDWEGFAGLTDELGGVPVYVPETVTDSANGVTWTRGTHLLDGDQALDYVRQRYGLPNGDLDRNKRQQAFLRGLVDQFRHRFGALDPGTSYQVLDVLTRHITVDEGFETEDLRSLLLDLADVRSDEVDFVSAPFGSFDEVDGQSVVRLDQAVAATLWRAVEDDEVADWVGVHPEAVTPRVVR